MTLLRVKSADLADQTSQHSIVGPLYTCIPHLVPNNLNWTINGTAMFLSIPYPFVSTQTSHRTRYVYTTVTNISSLTSFTETSSRLVYYRGQCQFTLPLPSGVGNLTYRVEVYPGATRRDINQTVIMGEWCRSMQHTRVAECAEMRGEHATGEQSLSECLLCALYVPCIKCMPGGVITGNSGLCCCVPWPVVCVMSTDRPSE